MFGVARLNTLSKALADAGYTGDIQAIGGDIVSFFRPAIGQNYQVHTFTTSGVTFQIIQAAAGATVDLFLVGGGGAGGGNPALTNTAGGGGGGGGVLFQTGNAVSITSYTINVGQGGTGASAAVGGAGGTTSALGFSASGGGGGAAHGATVGTNGGGSGTNLGTTNIATAGTYNFKGGNGFGSATSTQRASGGGAGYGGEGANAASSTGGSGGLGFQLNFDGNNYFYASGGGGSGSIAAGSARTKTGATNVTASYGAGRVTAGAGNSVTSLLAQDGAGGGGSYAPTAATAFAGGNGKQGIAMIRYPLTNTVSSYSFVNSTQTITTSLTPPTGILAGDIAVFIQGAANTTASIPTETPPAGWTQILISDNSTSPGIRQVAYYKICAGTESSGANFTCMSGTSSTQSAMYIYRPNVTPRGVQINLLTTQSTTVAPTNQSLALTTQVGPYIAIALAQATNGSGTLTTATSTPTRTTGPSGNFYYRTWEQTSSGSSFVNQTIGMADGGNNVLSSFVLQIF